MRLCLRLEKVEEEGEEGGRRGKEEKEEKEEEEKKIMCLEHFKWPPRTGHRPSKDAGSLQPLFSQRQ